MLFAEDLARAGWQCLHFADGGDLTDELRRELAARGVVAFEIDARNIGDKKDLLQALADALRFPAYFGRNWDAVIECLRDLPDRISGTGYVLFVRDGLGLWTRDPAAAGGLVEAWLSAAEDASHDEIALHLVFLSSAPKG